MLLIFKRNIYIVLSYADRVNFLKYPWKIEIYDGWSKRSIFSQDVVHFPALSSRTAGSPSVQLSAESATGVLEVATKARSRLVAPTGAVQWLSPLSTLNHALEASLHPPTNRSHHYHRGSDFWRRFSLFTPLTVSCLMLATICRLPSGSVLSLIRVHALFE